MANIQKSPKAIRCAVYTRKSSEEGLEQDFNSLDAQREACEAYIRSQKHEGWSAFPARYDDGGYSGGTMRRPALESLLADIRARKVDVVVVYKIDRLTRSLFDFAKIVEIFDAAGVSFVSVTQQFNTTTSMGRLTLNVLLSFAQFEREVTGERIRDKIAASKKKGMWMGGNVPLGYEARERKLYVVESEARTVRRLYELYLELGNVRLVKEEADRMGLRTRAAPTTAGLPFSRGHIYKILSNTLYAGRVAHNGQVYDGQHAPIIPADLWARVQGELRDRAVKASLRPQAKEPSPLAGILFDDMGDRLTPSHAVKKGRRYRYYIANRLIREKKNEGGLRLPAPEIEAAISAIVLDLLNDERKVFEMFSAGQTILPANDTILQKTQQVRDDLSKLGVYERLLKIRPALEKIVIGQVNLTVTVDLPRLGALLMGEATRSQPSQGNEQVSNSFAFELPFRVRRTGRELRLVLGSADCVKRPIDKSLIKLVSRGYAWRHEIVTGTAASATTIAKRENLTSAYVSRLIDLSFLAPDILAAMASGEAPADLTAMKLQSISNIPLDWASQRAVLGGS